MTEKYFKCTLISDVVLNSKMETEGNVTSLNYIPGSNFLGIVAKELYEQLSPEEALFMFHSKEILFGDATISYNNKMYYPVPFSYMTKKGEEFLGNNEVFLYHLLNENNYPRDSKGYKTQLKQKRSGYLSPSGDVIQSPIKTFSLKSAQDADTRKSKEGAMFGFESIDAGQEFIFSIQGIDTLLLNKAAKAVVGLKRVGKSKTAQYGQVFIEELDAPPQKVETFETKSYSLAYACSDLCFYDEGTYQPTFQPTAKQLGLNGEIDWSKSQVRTYTYSPWNGRRNTADSQRNCILAGSVFYINSANRGGVVIVGEYQAEGLGKIIVNPVFLQGDQDSAKLALPLKRIDEVSNGKCATVDSKVFKTDLGKFLKEREKEKEKDLNVSMAVFNALKNPHEELKKIPASQWGNIRNYAIRETDLKTLENKLFSTNNDKENQGYLTHGVAYDKHWGKKGELALNEFKQIFKDNAEYGTDFIAKYSSEMAKLKQKGGRYENN